MRIVRAASAGVLCLLPTIGVTGCSQESAAPANKASETRATAASTTNSPAPVRQADQAGKGSADQKAAGVEVKVLSYPAFKQTLDRFKGRVLVVDVWALT